LTSTVTLPVWKKEEGPHRLLVNHTAISVIEEKGEGFKKRKKQFEAMWFDLQPLFLLHRKT